MIDKNRPWRSWYNRARWKTLRRDQLWREPLCRFCREDNIIKAADTVDHIVQHKGDPDLFWDPDNLQSLCKTHHDATKQQIERRGYSTVAGADGWPIDPNHPANKPR